MKKILLFFLLVPAFCFGQNEIRTMVLHGDTLFVKNWGTNNSIQLNRGIPSQTGQSGKFLSTNGTTYQWASQSGGSGAPTFLNLASNFSNSTITQTAVTGWSFAVTTGKTYRIEIIANYQTAALTTGGTIGVYLTSGVGTIRGFAESGISQSAVATELKAPIRTCTTLGAAGSSLTSTGVGVINSPHSVYLLATFTCTSTGVLQIGWASEVAASAAQLNANSTLLYQILN